MKPINLDAILDQAQTVVSVYLAALAIGLAFIAFNALLEQFQPAAGGQQPAAPASAPRAIPASGADAFISREDA